MRGNSPHTARARAHGPTKRALIRTPWVYFGRAKRANTSLDATEVKGLHDIMAHKYY